MKISHKLKPAIGIAVVGVFAWLLGLRSWGRWYSSHVVFRLQTDALLAGTFALKPTPQSLAHDWSWGSGVQQVWGLGIPFVRLPFEAAARVVGASGFPDVLAFLFLFALAAWATSRAFEPARAWEQAALLVVTLLCPVFVNLCRTRFWAYEEAIGGGFLWAVLVGALLLGLAARPRPRALVLVCAAAGVAVLFRPTAIIYGLAAFAVAMIEAQRARLSWRVLALGALLFALGPALELAMNLMRFGHLLEFGYRVQLSYANVDRYAISFGYPFSREPLGRAAAELFSALFLSQRQSHGSAVYASGLLPLQSPTLRFREFYFPSFGIGTGAALLLSWGASLWALRSRAVDRRIATATLYSMLAFAGEFAFYLRTPTICSRYSVDFAAAVVFGLSALLLVLFALIRRVCDQRRARLWTAGITLFVCACTMSAICGAWFGEEQGGRHLLTAAELIAIRPPAPSIAPPLPHGYHCGESPQRTGIEFNGRGWDAANGCLVEAVTTFFLPSAECVNIQLASPTGTSPLSAIDTREVRANLGGVRMVRTRDVPLRDGRLLTFCRNDGRRNPTGIELLTIGWIAPTTLSISQHPFRLVALANAD